MHKVSPDQRQEPGSRSNGSPGAPNGAAAVASSAVRTLSAGSHDDGERWYVPASVGPDPGASEASWLVRDLWAPSAVGFVAGEPKVGKTWALCEMALAITTGAPMFDTFEVPETGPVLFVEREDNRRDLRSKLDLLVRGKGVALPDDLYLACERTVLIDDPWWQDQIINAAMDLGAAAVILDPLRRLHRAREDSSTEMNDVLSFLRELSNLTDAAVVVAHHTTKATDERRGWRAGQRLRGTSDFHAVLDSALFLKRSRDGQAIQVEVEHRARPATEPFAFDAPQAGSDAIRLTHRPGPPTSDGIVERAEEIERVLRGHPDGLALTEVRKAARRRGTDVDEALHYLVERGRAQVRTERRRDGRGAERDMRVWRSMT